VLVQNRLQTEAVLLGMDSETGSGSRLLVERDEAWLNLDQDMPYWLNDGSGFLWTTERRGAWQLELRNPRGELVSLLTPGNFIYKGLAGFDEKRRTAYVLGGRDPLQTHLFRIDVTPIPGPPRQLTTVPGIHSAEFSDSHNVYVHTIESAHGEVVSIVRDIEGAEIGRLRSVAEEPPFMPRPELTTIGTEPSLHALVIRPRNFDARLKYPVIVSVYGGPHGQTVMASARRYLLQQWMADHGFIVVSIDGRGTPARGREWERAIKGNLIELPLGDQVAGLSALGERYSEMDLTRVGIYGWSFGGYVSAMAVMQRPDVYRAAVAGAPVCDWRDYDTHYTERYMGMPDQNVGGYERASVLTHAPGLGRPMLIIHGTADDNVYFSHSLKISNALFRAGRHHELLALGDFTHMVADPAVTRRLYERIMSFLSRHLSQP
jgi:dipeptidyl-peptidase-4